MKNGEQLELNLLGFVASRMVEKWMRIIDFDKGLSDAKHIEHYAAKITPWVQRFLEKGFSVLYHPVCDAHGADVIIRRSGWAVGIDITCRDEKPEKAVYVWSQRVGTHKQALEYYAREKWAWPVSTASATDILKARAFVASLTGKKGRQAFT